VQAIVLLEDSVAVTPVGSISGVALLGENQLVVPTAQTSRTSFGLN
jgi:hypothetical protein